MNTRIPSLLATTFALGLMASTSSAQIIDQEDFESLDPNSPTALSDAGWLVFANVFDPGGGYMYGYGPFGAPNGGPGFCQIAVGQGGPDQGNHQIVTYSDYNNSDHGNGNLIEANVFKELIVPQAAVGNTVVFTFDAKHGDLAAPSTSLAFIKVIDSVGFWLDGYSFVDTTNMDVNWGTFSISLLIEQHMVGDYLQFGFSNTATNWNTSGQFYDNILFEQEVPCAQTYCGSSQNPNNSAVISITDCDSSAANIYVVAQNAPVGEFALLVVGDGNTTVQPPGSSGDLCVAGGAVLGRYAKEMGVTSSGGDFFVDIQNTSSNYVLNNVLIAPGLSWNFQFWHREGAGSTFSEAIAVTFN